MKNEYIDPVRIMQWEADSSISDSVVYLDGLICDSDLLPEQLELLYKIKLNELALKAKMKNYAELFAKDDAIGTLRSATYSANRFFETVVGKVQSLFANKNISVELKCEADNDSVLLDARRTRIILYNILSSIILNSTKAKFCISINVFGRGNELVIEITDNDKCISPKLCAELSNFEETLALICYNDVRAKQWIGLVVSKKLARDVGGDLTYIPSSRYNRFEVVFPQTICEKFVNDNRILIADYEEAEMYLAEALIRREETVNVKE